MAATVGGSKTGRGGSARADRGFAACRGFAGTACKSRVDFFFPDGVVAAAPALADTPLAFRPSVDDGVPADVLTPRAFDRLLAASVLLAAPFRFTAASTTTLLAALFLLGSVAWTSILVVVVRLSLTLGLIFGFDLDLVLVAAGGVGEMC